jgi:hypothetical protein
MNSSGFSRATGLIGLPPIARRLLGHDGRQPVDRLADAVEAAADHVLRHAQARHVLDQVDGGRGEVDARGLLEDLQDRVLLRHLDDLAAALAPGPVDDPHDGVVREVGGVLEEQEGARDVADLGVFLLEQVLGHGGFPASGGDGEGAVERGEDLVAVGVELGLLDVA